MTPKIKTEDILKWAVIGLIFVITFPYFEPTYAIGLDASYVWGLNWLFVHDYQTLIQLSYPFGPLAFLQIPTIIGHNWLIFLIFYGILKIGFIYLLFKLATLFSTSFKSAIPVVLIVCFFVNIDLLIIGNCLILNLLFYKRNKPIFLFISAILAISGLFIKVSTGISSLSIIFMSLLIDYYFNRNIIRSLKQIGIISGIGLIMGLLVFQGFLLLFQFLWGAFKLASGYEGALSLHPQNNWILLSLFMGLMASFPVWNKEKNIRVAYFLSLFALFAAWKHSFIRQDITHYRIIICFLLVFWSIILFVAKEKRVLTFIVACCTILLLYANMRAIPWYRGISREIVGVNNFIDVLHYKDFTQRITSMSEHNVAPNKLSEEQRALIGDYTVDVYPWEFSYIAANQLHWIPRKTFGISLFPSHGKNVESADYSFSISSPDLIIFHFVNDGFGGKLGSLDQRYILNDEPLVIYNILNHYQLEEKTNKFLLFKKDTATRFETSIWENPQIVQFNEWIDVPKGNNEIIRLKVSSKNTLWGNVKKMFYKEGQYYIDYMLEDGTIYTYRYVSGTAVDGLWISPFIRDPLSDSMEPDVVKVRLHNSHPRCIQSAVIVQFERIKLKEAHQ